MYTIVQSPDAAELIQLVNEKVREGYTPIGAMQTVLWYGQYLFTQTMIKQDHSWYAKHEKGNF